LLVNPLPFKKVPLDERFHQPLHESPVLIKDREVAPLYGHSHVSNQCAKALRMLHPPPKSVSRIRNP
jgi:hypothetical protein